MSIYLVFLLFTDNQEKDIFCLIFDRKFDGLKKNEIDGLYVTNLEFSS